jgi:hypothetical protein
MENELKVQYNTNFSYVWVVIDGEELYHSNKIQENNVRQINKFKVKFTEKSIDQTVLEDIPKNDEDKVVRCSAVDRVTNQLVLKDIAKMMNIQILYIDYITNTKF